MLKTPETLTLSLRPQRERSTADAWLFVGRTADVWMRELCAQGVDLDRCEGFILPVSLQDRTPGGLLVVVGAEAVKPLCSPAVQGYRYLGEKLLIPCDAALSTGLLSGELAILTPHHLAVFHPAIGLVGLEAGDCVMVGDLLGGWRERASNFSWAHPGRELQDRLHAVTARPVARVELLLADVRSEIGSQPAEQMPAAPDEGDESAIQRWRDRAKLRFLDVLKKIAGGQKPGEDPSWRRRLEAWAQLRIDAVRRDQARELERLLHLLKTDPDEGLKYALPLVGGQGRGSAPPPAKLSRRSAEFDLGNLKGGRPAAPWVVDWQKHYELSRQYREAANRELRLGRFRRAAYIFAELLKDYREAANVLRQGKHFREASVLYLKHLGDPLEAARCLRAGGFFAEAIPIFEKQKQYETVAELYRLLGNAEQAERHYRLAVARCLAHGQTIAAATLLERQLDDCEQAIAVLQAAWPAANDAVVCLQHELSLYERLGRLEALAARIAHVSADHPPSRALGLMETLVRLSRQSPVPAAQDLAERCAFSVAGRWLGSPRYADRRALLSLVRRLVPQDRLLLRDTVRFQEQCERDARDRRRALQAPASAMPLVVLDTRPLPNWVEWAVLEARGQTGFLGLGMAAHGATLLAYQWDGAFQTQMLPETPLSAARLSGCRLEIAHDALPEVVSILGMPLEERSALSAPDTGSPEILIENPPWVDSEGFLGMAYGGKGVAWVLRRHGGEEGCLVISSYSSMGDLIATHTIRLPFAVEEERLSAPVPMVYACEQIVFLCGAHLLRFYRDRVDCLSLEAVPERLESASVGGKLRLAVSYATDAEVFFGGSRWGRRLALELPVSSPRIAFTRTGDVLAASRDRLDLLGFQSGAFVPIQTELIDGLGDPLAVFRTDTANLYALVGQREVRRLRVDVRKKVS